MQLAFIWITLFLVSCVVTDILYAKVYNKHILISLGISILVLLFMNSPSFWLTALLSLLLSLGLGLLLFKFKVLGGGDVKAMLVVALLLNPEQYLHFLSYSIIWGGAFSLIYYGLNGSLFNLAFNTLGVYKKYGQATHKVPFTVGILLGWLSLSVLGIWS